MIRFFRSLRLRAHHKEHHNKTRHETTRQEQTHLVSVSCACVRARMNHLLYCAVLNRKKGKARPGSHKDKTITRQKARHKISRDETMQEKTWQDKTKQNKTNHNTKHDKPGWIRGVLPFSKNNNEAFTISVHSQPLLPSSEGGSSQICAKTSWCMGEG